MVAKKTKRNVTATKKSSGGLSIAHKKLWDELPLDLSLLLVKDLRAALVTLGLSPDGLKGELQDRLNDARPYLEKSLAEKALAEKALAEKAPGDKGKVIAKVRGEEEDSFAGTVKEDAQDPWLLAASRVSGVTYPRGKNALMGDPVLMLDVYAMPALCIAGDMSPSDLRTGFGLRTPLGEEIYQLWIQVSGATPGEASQLLKLLEDVCLLVDHHMSGEDEPSPARFFARYRERFTQGMAITKAIEVRLLSAISPEAALQVAVKGNIAMLGLSIGTADIAMRAKIPTATLKRARSEDEVDSEVEAVPALTAVKPVIALPTFDATLNVKICKYCKLKLKDGTNIFRHFKTCALAKKARK